MVKGLQTFREYFRDFTGNYIIIGGTACDMILEAAELTARATKDIDLVLVVEALNDGFVQQFWKFIQDGKYQRTEMTAGERKYYRFQKPENNNFPWRIELFSRVPDLLKVDPDMHLTPIPAGEDQSDLSAILMNDAYYDFTRQHCTEENRLQRADPASLICLAKAFLDITERKQKGGQGDEKKIKKHKGDVFRLGALLKGDDKFEAPSTVKDDLQLFAEAVKNDLAGAELFKQMGLGGLEPPAVRAQLIQSFGLKE